MDTKTVLLPLDGSSFSQHMLAYLSQIIKPEDSEVIVLRIAPWPKGVIEQSQRISPINWLLPLDPVTYEAPPKVETGFQPIYASQEAERLRGQIMDELGDQTRALREAGYQVTCTVEFGAPAEEIINFAEQHAVDLIAMATHGRSGLSHLVLGSVAEQVLHKVRVPVLLVRPTAYAPPLETRVRHEHDAVVA